MESVTSQVSCEAGQFIYHSKSYGNHSNHLRGVGCISDASEALYTHYILSDLYNNLINSYGLLLTVEKSKAQRG